MAKFPFDAILFDVGGVLLTNGWDREERSRVVPRFGLDLEAFEARHSTVYRRWETGGCTEEEYMRTAVFNELRSFTPEEFFAAICAGSRVLPDGAMPVLKELAVRRPCLIGALNNEARETNDYRFRRFGLREIFEVALTSCYLGLRKPDAAMYRCALDVLGRPAERILFIDDRADNVAAAEAAGMRAIHFTGEAALRAELLKAGIPPG